MKQALFISGASALTLKQSVNPVTRVVDILKNMKQGADHEAKQDDKIYKDAVCYCDKENTAATDAIADANEKLSRNNGDVVQARADIKKLGAEIDEADAELKKKDKELTKLRKEFDADSREFNSNFQEKTSFIGSLKSAITVLNRKFGDVSAKIQDAGSYEDAKREALGSDTKAAAAAELKGLNDSGMKKQVLGLLSANSKASGSEILGMLKRMLEDFENENKEASENFAQNKADFESQQASFENTISTKRKERLAARKERGEKMRAMEDGEAAYIAAEEKLSANQQKLDNLKVDCANLAKDYKQRTDVREDEKSVLQQTIDLLDSDQATEKFGAGYSLLQTGSGVSVKDKAIMKLKSVKGTEKIVSALQLGKVDYFSAVVGQINNMVNDIKEEMKEQVEKRDLCRTEIQDRKVALVQDQSEFEIANRDLQSTQSLLKTNEEEIAQTTTDRDEAQKEMTSLQINRVEASMNYQKNLKQLEDSIAIIREANTMLKEFYRGKSPPTAFVQTSQLPSFSDDKQKQAAGSVFDVLDKIIGDTNKEISATVQSDNDGARSFQDSWLNAQRLRNDGDTRLGQLKGENAQLMADKVDGIKANTTKIADVKNSDSNLVNKKSECAFLLDNFDTIQGAGYDEISTLQQATQILRGAIE